MSDSRLHKLKRDWESDGSVAAEAAYLQERVRVGDLRLEQVKLAALCGHVAAAQVAKVSPPPDFTQWAQDLSALGGPTSVRAAVGAASLVVDLWRGPSEATPPVTALQALVAWLASDMLSTVPEHVEELCFLAMAAGRELAGPGAPSPKEEAAMAIAESVMCLRYPPVLDKIFARVLYCLEDDSCARAKVRSSVEQELISWVLASPS